MSLESGNISVVSDKEINNFFQKNQDLQNVPVCEDPFDTRLGEYVEKCRVFVDQALEIYKSMSDFKKQKEFILDVMSSIGLPGDKGMDSTLLMESLSAIRMNMDLCIRLAKNVNLRNNKVHLVTEALFFLNFWLKTKYPVSTVPLKQVVTDEVTKNWSTASVTAVDAKGNEIGDIVGDTREDSDTFIIENLAEVSPSAQTVRYNNNAVGDETETDIRIADIEEEAHIQALKDASLEEKYEFIGGIMTRFTHEGYRFSLAQIVALCCNDPQQITKIQNEPMLTLLRGQQESLNALFSFFPYLAEDPYKLGEMMFGEFFQRAGFQQPNQSLQPPEFS